MKLTVFGWISIFAISAAVVNAIGIYLVYKEKRFVGKAVTYFMCLAAGLLISAPLIFAFPHAVRKNSMAGMSAMVGFLFMLFSNKVISKKVNRKNLAFGITAIEGVAIHSLADGIIYTVTFNASILIGFLSGLGLVLHEFAEGVIAFSILIEGGMERKKAVLWALFTASLTTPIGAFIAYPFVSLASPSLLGLLLGFVVGVLIYVSASHLLPEAREKDEEHSVSAFLAGILLSLLLGFLKH
ncbi:MAG: ZIP family metal transporter [Elusimicrobiota bacterium]